MGSIRGSGKPPPPPERGEQAPETSAQPQEGPTGQRETAQGDHFADHTAPRGAIGRPDNPQLQAQLQAIGAQTAWAKIHFSDEDLRLLAGTFASLIKGKRGASRKERARLFARAALKSKRLGKLLANLKDEELEKMCEAIGHQLDESPGFAQLVDDISEKATTLRSKNGG